MKKWISILVTLSMLLAMTACGGEEEVSAQYFESDEKVEAFFVDYNEIAEIKIDAEAITEGNIRTKAIVSTDDLYMTVINATDFLTVSIDNKAGDESVAMWPVFRDVVLTMRPETDKETIQSFWDSIHESGYMENDVVFEDMTVTYIPLIDKGDGKTSDNRIDIDIPYNDAE